MIEQKDVNWKPADDVNRAKALLKTAWLAMLSESFSNDDHGDVADTLFEAMQRLARAEKNMGLYK